MDDRGRIYEIDEEKGTKKNVETGKTTALGSNWEKQFTMLPPDEVERLKQMNRADRRAWLRRFKSKLSQLQGQSEVKNEIP